MPPSRRQPPRSTPPVRRPRVAGLRKPGATDGTEATPSPALRPTPRPKPAVTEPAPEPEVADEAVEAPEEVLDGSEVAAAESGDESTKLKSKASGQLLLAGALVVVGLLLAAGAVIFKIQADGVSSSTNNTALLDVAKTAQVKDQVSKATEALFSYDYNNIAKTETSAADLLVNDEVRGKYNLLMGEVKRLAPQQKMVVTCKVTRSAVIRLEGDRADVMVFVDQRSTRADTNKTTAGSAQLHLNAELQGDKWKITAMNTYAAPGAPAQPSAPASPAPSK